ncbi:MAG: DUF1989 domain-containing protein [Candidatus Dormibacteraceae bacterium]
MTTLLQPGASPSSMEDINGRPMDARASRSLHAGSPISREIGGPDQTPGMQARSDMRLYVDPARPGKLALGSSFYHCVDSLDRRPNADPGARRSTLHAWVWPVRRGQVFRIVGVEGAQLVGLNVWNLHNPRARFSAGRSRQIHGMHVSAHDRLQSCSAAQRGDRDRGAVTTPERSTDQRECGSTADR